MWVSMKPGSTVPPSRSVTPVVLLRRPITSSVDPVAAIRPSRTAIACTMDGPDDAIVWMRPFT